MKLGKPSGEWLELAGNTFLSLSGLALVYYLLYFRPVGYVYFVTEDYWAEWGTFVGWAMTFCLLAWTLLKDKDARKPALFVFCLGAFIVAGEEISWGQRVLALGTPDFFVARNVQREITIHNLFSYNSALDVVDAMIILLWSTFLPMLARRSTRVHGWCSRLGIPIVPFRLWPLFLLAVYFNIFSSLRSAEVAELYLSIAMAALSLDLVLTKRLGTRARGVVSVGASAGMIVMLGVLTAVLVRSFPWEDKLKRNVTSFALFQFPAKGMHRQAAVLSDYIRGDPQYLHGETILRQAIRLMRLGRLAQVRNILEQALTEQERIQQRHPAHPAPHRIAGQLLTLLARPQEAERAFLEAIELDRARLDRANEGATKAWINFSLGETLFAMGDFQAASKQFALARALATDRRTRWQMDDIKGRWEKRNVGARWAR